MGDDKRFLICWGMGGAVQAKDKEDTEAFQRNSKSSIYFQDRIVVYYFGHKCTYNYLHYSPYLYYLIQEITDLYTHTQNIKK